jgi:hypothetical protein
MKARQEEILVELKKLYGDGIQRTEEILKKRYAWEIK